MRYIEICHVISELKPCYKGVIDIISTEACYNEVELPICFGSGDLNNSGRARRVQKGGGGEQPVLILKMENPPCPFLNIKTLKSTVYLIFLFENHIIY